MAEGPELDEWQSQRTNSLCFKFILRQAQYERIGIRWEKIKHSSFWALSDFKKTFLSI